VRPSHSTDERCLKTICFIVTSFWAYGELNIAIDFALRLRDAGYDPLFLVPPSHEKILKQNNIQYFTLVPKSRKLNLIVFTEIQNRHQPEAIVLSDFLNYLFCERHYGLTLDDLSIFSGKIGTFDIYDYDSTNGKVDTYGFVAKNMHGLSLKSYDFLLQPCPVNHLQQKHEREFRYSLFGQLKQRTQEQKEAARKALKLKPGEKVLLITSAVWQQRYRLYKDIVPFIKTCIKMMETVLDMLPESFRIISVGSQVYFSGIKKRNFTHYNEMLPGKFKKITDATDIYLCNNYISTSMIKNVLSGVPTLLVQNSIFKRDGKESWFKYRDRKLPKILDDCPVAYPFRTFPVGWYGFLRDIVKENPFYSLMLHSEAFTPKTMKNKILKILEEPRMFEEQRKAYVASLMELPTVEKDFKL
jgi:hypothetical protein